MARRNTYFFKQAMVREKMLSAAKVAGTKNPSDIGAKALNTSALAYLMRKANFVSSPSSTELTSAGPPCTRAMLMKALMLTSTADAM